MLSFELSHRLGTLEVEVAERVGEGECLALIGPSGAGKSTVLRLLAGLEPGGAGSLDVEGRELTGLPPEQRGIGYVFQEYALFERMSALDNVAYGLRGMRRVERRRRAAEWLERLGLADRAGARPAELSGGERQRVALARALAPEPRALLLDEPLAALDARTRREASATLAATIAELAIPAVLVTHEFTEAALLADRIAVLDAGRIVQAATAAELCASPASPLVADLAGAVVLRGQASRAAGGGEPGGSGLTVIELDGGGTVRSTDPASGEVSATVFPWEISLDPPGTGHPGSALNHLEVEVVSVTEFGNRARVALAAPQPLAAEVTSASAARLGLAPGVKVEASWKATATRVITA